MCAALAVTLAGMASGQETGNARSNPATLAQGLKEVRELYGDDAVALQTLLFVNALKADPPLAVEVGVDGLEESRGRKWLMLHVHTGLVFNTKAQDQPSRLRAIWSRIVAPSLLALKSLRLPAEGVAITLVYSHRAYANREELQETIENPGEQERAIVNLTGRDVLALMAGELSEQDLLDRSDLSVNGSACRLILEGAAPQPPIPRTPAP